VIRVQTVPGPIAIQYRWPYNGAEVDGDFELYPYDWRWWSKADKTTGATCNGVWVDKYDIGIQPNPGDAIGSSIKLPTASVDPAVNRFVARVQNNWEKEILVTPFLERIDASGVSCLCSSASPTGVFPPWATGRTCRLYPIQQLLR